MAQMILANAPKLGVRLDKSEGAVKDKNILGSAEHRLLRQRG
jgi:hypothetical protein